MKQQKSVSTRVKLVCFVKKKRKHIVTHFLLFQHLVLDRALSIHVCSHCPHPTFGLSWVARVGGGGSILLSRFAGLRRAAITSGSGWVGVLRVELLRRPPRRDSCTAPVPREREFVRSMELAIPVEVTDTAMWYCATSDGVLLHDQTRWRLVWRTQWVDTPPIAACSRCFLGGG